MAVRKHRRRGAPVPPRKDEPEISEKTRPVKAKDKSKKALIVAQEIKIARLLANNDKKVRDKVLKRLNKWLTVRSQSSFGKSAFALLCRLHDQYKYTWTREHFVFFETWCTALRFLQCSRSRTSWACGKAFFTVCGCRTRCWSRKNWRRRLANSCTAWARKIPLYFTLAAPYGHSLPNGLA